MSKRETQQATAQRPKRAWGWMVAVLCLGLGVGGGARWSARADAPELLESPLAFIQALQAEMDAALKAPLASRHAAFIGLLEANVSFEEFARRSLGYHWATLTGAQQALYLASLRTLLERAYINRLLKRPPRYRIEWEGEHVQDSRARVSLVVRHEDTETEIEFDLQKRDASWEIVDVSYDGLSAATAYQRSHGKIFREQGFDALLTHMQQHADDQEHGPL